MNASSVIREVILQASAKLADMSIPSDHLMLTAWYAAAVIQRLLGESGDSRPEHVEAENALRIFASEQQDDAVVDRLRRAYLHLARSDSAREPLLTVVPESLRRKVRQGILDLVSQREWSGGEIDTSLQREQKSVQTFAAYLSAGPRHRLGLLVGAASDPAAAPDVRRTACAAVAYIQSLQPESGLDTPILLALLKDSATRVALSEFVRIDPHQCFHWSERIALLFDGLPFLQGVDLADSGNPSVVTWLDRVNSYVGYQHVLDGERAPLICIEPSTVCSPLHLLISLLGLLILEGLTSTRNLAATLNRGQIYEVDGKYHCEYAGTSDEMNGMLRLKFRDGFIYCSPSIARRMVPVSNAKLSRGKEFAAVTAPKGEEPIQKFFGWPEAIGMAAVSGRLVFISSRDRAVKLFGDISSNGVLLSQGLIGFAGPGDDLKHFPATIIVVPTLAIARQIADCRDDVSAIIIDGYDRLRRGRSELPFLQTSRLKPPIIVWSHQGEVPAERPEWLPDQKSFEFRREDLQSLVELDDDGLSTTTPTFKAISAAVALTLEKKLSPNKESELRAIASITDFVALVSISEAVPEFWKYHLLALASRLRALIDATPAYWDDIKSFAQVWNEEFTQAWEDLRPAAALALTPIRESHARMLIQIRSVTDTRTSKADALLSFLASQEDHEWVVVCDYSQQLAAMARFSAQGVKATKIQDLEACQPTIVCGWTSFAFVRHVGACTPRRLVLIGDSHDHERWRRALEPGRPEAASFIEFIKHGEIRLPEPKVQMRSSINGPNNIRDEETFNALVDCIFIWPSEGTLGKIVERDSRILVESGEHVADKRANLILPGDRVVLGTGSRRWSPAEEFTQAVVDTIEKSSPDLIRHARAWRAALFKAYKANNSSVKALKAALDSVQVHREPLTIEGWLHLERAAPIGPQHIKRELEAIWQVIGQFTDVPVVDGIHACSRLRSLRSMAGRALLKEWKGYQSEAGVDREWLAGLLTQLKRQVEVHEVERISFGHVPSMMLGWWISEDTAEQFSVESAPRVTDFLERADEIELADE